jgi:hypothetical protein
MGRCLKIRRPSVLKKMWTGAFARVASSDVNNTAVTASNRIVFADDDDDSSLLFRLVDAESSLPSADIVLVVATAFKEAKRRRIIIRLLWQQH